MIVTLFIVIGPLCFILIGGLALLVISCYNKCAYYFYKKKVDKLEAKQKDLNTQLNDLTGKKDD